jgi:ABC-type transport system substrate-binding protein
VYDDGYGCYIGNEDQNIEEPIFTADLLRKTILDPETGYNSHPSVVSGPYMLTSYDYETAHFEINPYFKGAWVNNTLPEDFHFDMENLSGAGSGTMAHHNANLDRYIKVDRLDKDGNEDPFYMIKPSIEKIAFTVADNDTIAEDLSEGRLHLVNKVVYGPAIMECMGTTAGDAEDDEFDPDAFSEEEPEEAEQEESEEEPEEEELDISGIRYQNYPRIGLAFLTFTYDWPTVKEMEVRQAIAWCMDREQLAQDYCSGFGVVVNGYYGMEQWEYLLVTGQLDFPVNMLDEVLPPVHEEDEEEKLLRYRNRYVRTQEEFEAAVDAWKTLVKEWDDGEGNTLLTEYCVDLDKANAILDSAKWTLNRNGEKYQPGVDDVRCKEIDGELVALDLKMMYPEGNHMIEFMQTRTDEEPSFVDNLAEVGIKVTFVPTPMEDLLHSYYRETERTTDMIYLATNFHVMVDPSITYSTDDTLNHQIWNNTYSDDEDLFYRAVNMRKTEPMDVFEYVSKWMSFQQRYNEVLPTIPIYSNIYFDFWNAQLQNYHITGSVTWSQAILEAYFGEEREEEPEEEDDEDLGDGEMMFE